MLLLDGNLEAVPALEPRGGGPIQRSARSSKSSIDLSCIWRSFSGQATTGPHFASNSTTCTSIECYLSTGIWKSRPLQKRVVWVADPAIGSRERIHYQAVVNRAEDERPGQYRERCGVHLDEVHWKRVLLHAPDLEAVSLSKPRAERGFDPDATRRVDRAWYRLEARPPLAPVCRPPLRTSIEGGPRNWELVDHAYSRTTCDAFLPSPSGRGASIGCR
jgi:hypothetical protein